MENAYMVIDKPDNRLLGVIIKFIQKKEDEKDCEQYKYISYESDIRTCIVDSPIKALENFRQTYPNALLLSILERESPMGYTHKILKENF